MKPRNVPDNVLRGHLKRLLRSRGEPEVTLCNRVEDIMEERRRRQWGRHELGQNLGVTFGELSRLKLFATMGCVDRSKPWLQEYMAFRRRDRDRMKKARKRAMMKNNPNADLSPRALELCAVLAAAGGGWMPSRDIVERLRRRWRRASGRPLKSAAVAKAVARAARELCQHGAAHEKIEIRRGRFPTRFLRPIPAPPHRHSGEISPETLSSKTKTCPPDRREQQTSAFFASGPGRPGRVPPESLNTEGTRQAGRPEEVAEEAIRSRREIDREGIESGGGSKSEALAVLRDRRRDVRVAARLESGQRKQPEEDKRR